MEEDLAHLLGQTSLSTKGIDESDDDWLDNKRKPKKGKKTKKNPKQILKNQHQIQKINQLSIILRNVQYVELLLNQEINCLIMLNLKVMQLHHRNQNLKRKINANKGMYHGL